MDFVFLILLFKFWYASIMFLDNLCSLDACPFIVVCPMLYVFGVFAIDFHNA